MLNNPKQVTRMESRTTASGSAFEDGGGSPPVHVFLMDLLSMVPYYTGHLCASLTGVRGVQVTLGSITYSHDRFFFKRAGLRNDPGLLDVAYILANAVAPVRQALKAMECLVNMATLSLRFLISKPDVIHVQFIPLVDYGLPFEMWFLKLARSLGIKLAYTVHNILPHDSSERHRAIYARIYKFIDGFVCHDLFAKARLVSEFQVSPDRVSVIPHGPLFGPELTTLPEQTRTHLGFPRDVCVVLWQGIVRPYKGISFLLKAWQMAHEAGLKGILVIVGTGEKELLSAIEDDVSERGVSSSVRLVFRFVSVGELLNFYGAADIVVYPYSDVTTSGALMTGVGFGKAIVASALPGFKQLLHHEDNALLVRYGDVEALAAALLRLAGDPELRLRLGARLQADQSDAPRWVDIAQRTSRFYHDLLFSPSALKESTNCYSDATGLPR